MSTINDIIARIERYCQRHKIAESTFGRMAVNDGKLIHRLRDGGSITLETLSKIDGTLARAPSPSKPRERVAS